MKTIEALDGDLNLAGPYTETYGILNSVLWEHPDKPGWFIMATFGYGGVKFKRDTEEIAISFNELFALMTGKDPALLPVLPIVTADHPAGAHPQTVALSCTQAGVQIRYTTNGTEPTSASTLYAGPLTISAAETLKAKAFKTNWQPSLTASFTYT
jgi:Chitobiase/beta-hexosaminidase C-terminal domain